MTQTLDPRLHRNQYAADADAQDTAARLEQLVNQRLDLRLVQCVEGGRKLTQDEFIPALLHLAFTE